MRFRPCIDLHEGVVKQIVGSTLVKEQTPTTLFTSDRQAADYAALYRQDGLSGGHVIKLGPGNDSAAAAALATFPGGLQLGGGVNLQNADQWLQHGASAVIITSYAFEKGALQPERIEELSARIEPTRLVLDLSCVRHQGGYVVTADRWQSLTDLEINEPNLNKLSVLCGEFLVHATQVEGKQSGPDPDLLQLLGDCTPLPTTYAGGISTAADIDMVANLGGGRLDFTVGSALDLFGGNGLRYADLLQFR